MVKGAVEGVYKCWVREDLFREFMSEFGMRWTGGLVVGQGGVRRPGAGGGCYRCFGAGVLAGADKAARRAGIVVGMQFEKGQGSG